LFSKRPPFYTDARRQPTPLLINSSVNKKAVLSQGKPCDAAVNFDAYRNLQRHRTVSLLQHSFLAGLCA